MRISFWQTSIPVRTSCGRIDCGTINNEPRFGGCGGIFFSLSVSGNWKRNTSFNQSLEDFLREKVRMLLIILRHHLCRVWSETILILLQVCFHQVRDERLVHIEHDRENLDCPIWIIEFFKWEYLERRITYWSWSKNSMRIFGGSWWISSGSPYSSTLEKIIVWKRERFAREMEEVIEMNLIPCWT